MICASCSERHKVTNLPNVENTIWNFQPYIYETYNDMHTAFTDFVVKYYDCNPNPIFYESYNEDGYTFTQWQIYYLSRNLQKYRNHWKPTMWLFRILSKFTFFRDMIRQGKKTDSCHHTLVHFMKYVEKYGGMQKKMVELLTRNGLSMDDEDIGGSSGNTYLLHKIMRKEHLKMADEFTKTYKRLEDDLFDNIELRRCEECFYPVAKYDDLIEFCKSTFNLETLKETLQQIRRARQDCNMVYRCYANNHSIQRHQYIIDIYKSILS